MKIDVAELIEQFTKLKTWLADNKEQIGKMNTGVTTFVSETQSTFQGEAGDGMRACMTDIFTPLHQQFEVTEQTLTQAVDTIKNKAESYFGTNGIVDDAYLDEWLNQVERTVRDFDYVSDDIDAKVGSIHDLISVSKVNREPFHEPLYVMKSHVAEIKSQMKDFEAEANNLTNQVSTEVSKLTSMLKEVSRFNGDMSTYKSGSFKFSTLSMHKNSKSIYPLTLGDLNTSEVEYVKNLEQQFGFSEEEALLMLGIYRGLKNKYPSESEKDIGRRFSRLMSQSTYGGWQWNLLAGNGNLREEMESMGFPKEEVQFLEDTIHMNYRGTSDNEGKIQENAQNQIERLRERYPTMSDKEISELYYKRFHDKNDFAHQMVVTAVCLHNIGGPDSDIAGTSSYIGDIRGVALTGDRMNRGMDNPDYKADLDGYNIAVDQQTSSDKSFMDITNDYYNRIDQDKQGFGTTKTRASEFLYHKGYESERKYGPFGNYNKKYEEYVGQGIERVEWEINLNLMKEDWTQTEEDRRFIEALRRNQSNY